MLHTACLCIIFSCLSHAQPPVYNFSIESRESVKPEITCLIQASSGYIYCGSTKGLYRFNGVNFLKVEDQPGGYITSLFEDRDSVIWIGYNNGNIGFIRHNKFKWLRVEEGFPKVAVRAVCQDNDGNLYFGTAGEGVYYYKNKRLYNVDEDDGLSDNYIYKLVYSSHYGLIAATDRGINFISPLNRSKKIRSITSKDGLPDNMVKAMNLSQNMLFLGLQNGLLVQYDLQQNILSPPISLNPVGEVNDVLFVGNDLYVASQDSGLVVLNMQRKKVQTKSLRKDFQKINSLLQDTEGNMWVAAGNWLNRLPNTSVQKIYTLSANDAKAVHCLYYSEGGLWLNSERGIQHLTENEGVWVNKNYLLKDLSGSNITSMYKDDAGLLWIGFLGNGIVLFNPISHTHKSIDYTPLKSSNIISISGNNDKVWVSALEGVFAVTTNNNRYLFKSFADTGGIGQKYVYDIYSGNTNKTWFATDGKGISFLDNNTFTTLTANKGYKGKVVYKIKEDASGDIWYSTYDAGLIKYDHQNFKAYTQQQGLSSNEIINMAFANDKIVLFHKKNIDLIEASSGFISYPNLSGFDLDISADLNACTSDENGNVYFISDGSVYKYAVPAERLQMPRVLIDKVQAFLRDIDAGQNVFKHDENNLTFYYTGLYYSQPEKIMYQYMLQGYDENWVMTNDRVKTFSSLPRARIHLRLGPPLIIILKMHQRPVLYLP